MSQSDFPIFRITVLGIGGAGKTSIINNFVNNSFSSNYQETDLPTLFFKVVRLAPEDDDKAKAQSMCVEIEDTYSSVRTEEGRDIRNFLDMRRKNMLVAKGANDYTPFNIWKPPLVPLAVGQKYQPITQGRMGFLIVFDSTDDKSFEEAVNIHVLLTSELERRQERLRPVVFLVANKIDKDPESEEFLSVIAQAEAYSQKSMLRLWKVSAAESKNIKKMFKDMLYLISGAQVLWQLEVEEESESEEEQKCPVM